MGKRDRGVCREGCRCGYRVVVRSVDGERGAEVDG